MKKKVLLTLMMVTLSMLAFGTITVFAETEGIYTYSVTNGEATITNCDTSAIGEIVIPDTLGGYPVTSIGKSAFLLCRKLTNIIVGDSVTTICDYAFWDCSRLTSVTIGNSVTSIGYSAFKNCTKLETITIPDSTTLIGNSTFENCTALSTITIRGNVTSIGERNFYDCNSLSTVYYNGNQSDWDKITIASENDKLLNATRKYFYCVTLLNDAGKEISKKMQNPDTFVDLSGVVVPEGCELVLYEDSNFTKKFDETTGITENLTLYAHFIRTDSSEFEGAKIEFSDNGKIFLVNPINVNTGETVILVIYHDDKFVEIHTAVYRGEAIAFATEKTYTSAKVMVWDDITNLKPIYVSETVK